MTQETSLCHALSSSGSFIHGPRNPEAAIAGFVKYGEALTGWPQGNSFRLSFIHPRKRNRTADGGTDIRTVQSLLGYVDVSTTMIYLHIMKRPGAGAPSPPDTL